MYSESPLSVQSTSTYHYKVQYQDRVMPAPVECSQPGRTSKKKKERKKKTIFHHPNFGTMERILCAATIYSCWFFFLHGARKSKICPPVLFLFVMRV